MKVTILCRDDHTIEIDNMPDGDLAELLDDFKLIECTVLTVMMGDPDSVIYINKDAVITIETSASEPNNHD